MNDSTAAMDIHTILFVLGDFFELLEFDSSVVDGPSARFAGRRPDVGGFCSGFGPGKNGSAGGGVPEDVGGGVPEDVGGGNGAVLLLNGFPSLLHVEKKN